MLGEWNGHATHRGNSHLKPTLVSGDRYISEFLQKTGGHPCDNSLTETTCHRVQNVVATSCPCSSWSHRRRAVVYEAAPGLKGLQTILQLIKSRYLWIGIVRGRFWCGSDHPDGSWSLDTWSQQIGSAFVIGSSAIGNRCHQLAIFVINWQSLSSRGAQLAIGDIIILFTAATAPIAADCSDLQGLNKCLLLNWKVCLLFQLSNVRFRSYFFLIKPFLREKWWWGAQVLRSLVSVGDFRRPLAPAIISQTKRRKSSTIPSSVVP